jgi:histidine ammonia-lyase
MALRAQCLSQGYSGVNPKVVDSLLGFKNSGIIPTVRQYGSIGASGDLIPLASIATALIGGNTDVFYQGKILPAAKAISKANLSKLSLSMRDGLALINGTSFMTAIASLGVFDLKRLFVQMLSTVAMALESLMVINCAYNPVVHQLKNQSGEIEVNEFLNHFWQGSQLLTDIDQLILLNKNDHNYRIQDYYSIRAVAQGFGPFIENLKMAELWVENEINSVNDNPIIDASKKKILHNANFMGYYITDACDLLKMDIAQASTWLHALLANMVHPRKNNLLPTNLVSNPEIHNGFRPLQLLVASIAVQNRKLGQSHQSYMLPTEGDNQDVNSLGTHAAFDLRESVGNLEKIISILLVASVQALEFRGIEKSCYKSQLVCKNIRKLFPAISAGRPLTNELETVISALREGNIIPFFE